jgi:hypothetical protein
VEPTPKFVKQYPHQVASALNFQLVRPDLGDIIDLIVWEFRISCIWGSGPARRAQSCNGRIGDSSSLLRSAFSAPII